VSLSTAYALGDVLGLKHSLHRGAKQAKGFYVMYAGLIGLAAAIVLIPGSPLGLLTEGVQVLAGVLLPSATVFLLLLCNDKAVLGPWVNGRWTNAFAGVVIALLITLSLILTASVALPHIKAGEIVAILLGCTGVTVVAGGWIVVRSQVRRRSGALAVTEVVDRAERERWRMPPLATLTVPSISLGRKLTLLGMWVYLVIAMGVVVLRVVELATAH
jgi:Natural resistance-associated macrophage protein